MQNTKRVMTITRSPGEDNIKPMLRITNGFLLNAGFAIGTKLEVKYGKGVITITLLPNQDKK